jgi:molecular chaperone GrpE
MAQKPGPATADVDAQSGGRSAAHQPAEHAHGRRDGEHGEHRSHRSERPEAVNGRHGEHAVDYGAAETGDTRHVGEAGNAGAAAPPDRIAELEAALAAAKAEAAENWDKFLRLRAEMENYKRRLERSQADQIKRERRDLLLKTLGVLDNLDRAVAYQAAGAAPVDPKALLTGLQMTYSQFKDLLASEGLQEVNTVGEQFDPRLHEAVSAAVTPDVPEGQIVEEIQKGYLLGDDLLRPARVKVATRQ